MNLSALSNEKEIGKSLAEAISIQTEVANRSWLAMLAAIAVVVLPHETRPGYIALPFNFADVKTSLFHPIGFCMLAVIAIAFAAAHARHLEIQQFAQSVLDSLPDDMRDVQRKLFDINRKPSLLLVSSLAWSLRGQARSCPTWRRSVAVLYYWLLKMTSLIVYYFLPIIALWVEAYKASTYLDIWYLFFFGSCLATASLLQVCWVDLRYALGTNQRLRREGGLEPVTHTTGASA